MSESVAISDIDVADVRFQFRFQTQSEDLRSSIAENGQLNPITLWRPRKNARYLIVDGFRRTDACIALGLETVDANVIRCTEDQAYGRAYVENVVRKNLTPLEKATGICAVIDRVGKKRAAEQIKISSKQLNRYIELLEAPSLTKRALGKGTISMAHALIISEYLPSVRMPEADLIRLAELNSAAELRKLLKKKRNNGRPKKFTRIDDEMLRMYPFRFNRVTASKEDRQKVSRALRAALKFVEG
jgi:ParB/RepB/Spo0J family partition protein|tara:strand:- start:5533 stop:6264 length:732 start_codon:yes stop_codon:yes gene_type:complete